MEANASLATSAVLLLWQTCLNSPELPSTDHYVEFITSDVTGLNDDEEFDPIQYWNERYHSQTDLARMALDVLALPPMSDECRRLFSSAKLLLTDHRSRLRMDVIETSECLRAWYGRPEQKAFDDSAIGLMEGEAGSTVRADGPGEGEEGGDDDGSEESNILETQVAREHELRS
jgi:hypothetical protein